MKVLGIYNLKGGTGKTTIAVHLAPAFAAAGWRTLLVGMDRQGDAIRWITGGDANVTNGAVMQIRPGLTAIFSAEEYPKLALQRAAALVDLVVADLPPREGLASGVPADLWLVPVDGRLALEDLLAVVDEMKEMGAEVLVVFNRADAGGKRILSQLQRAASNIPGVTIWSDIIPDSAAIKRAGDLLRSVKDVPFGEGSPGDVALNALAQVVLRQLGLVRATASRTARGRR